MHIKIYEGGIMAPVKCGTRYLTHNNLKELSTLSVPQLGRRFLIPELKWIIIRNPLEGFISALHTDVLHIINGLDKNLSTDEWNDTLNEGVINLLFKYKDFNNEYGHFHRNIYRELYWLWRRLPNRKDVKIIDLSELNNYTTELGLYQPYDSKDYNFDWFDIWADKESVALWVKTCYKEHYNSFINHIMENETDGEMKFYNHLKNGDVLPIKLF